jgi:hypothetical protein
VQITEWASQCDMTTPVFAELGGLSHDIGIGSGSQPAGIRFLDVPAGTVRRVAGAEQARALPGVLSVEVGCRAGDILRPVTSSFDRIGWIVAAAPDHSQLAAVLTRAVQSVRVCVERP